MKFLLLLIAIGLSPNVVARVVEETEVVAYVPIGGPTQAPVEDVEVVFMDPPQERLVQAKELLGKYYRDRSVAAGHRESEIDEFVRSWIADHWRKRPKMARRVAKTIVRESERYGFDPIFLVAVIENESSFRPGAVGPCGEIGLMQLRPRTARWIANLYRIRGAAKRSLKDPITNIRIGAAYLDFLRERFRSHGRLYLAAYNQGPVNTDRAVVRRRWEEIPQAGDAPLSTHICRIKTTSVES
jgi:hypothetical protein